MLTKAKAKTLEHLEARGGIIADDMGLGKSLVMLSAIARSLNEAATFACAHKNGLAEPPRPQIASRATLILVPSTSTYVLNWVSLTQLIVV